MIHHDFLCKDDFARLSVVAGGANGYHPPRFSSTKEGGMRKHHDTRWMTMLGAVLLVLAVPAACLAGHPSAEVQVDAGYTVPGGDLGDDFAGTPQGFGADPGYEVGLLWRYRFDLRWSLAAAGHFTKFSDFSGTDEIAGDYTVGVTGFRYVLQARRSFGGGTGWQPFLMAGGGVFRNRVQGRDKVLLDPFDRSVTTLGATLGLGIRRGDVELGAVWNINRFSSWRFFAADTELDYNWDTLSVRFSWLIPQKKPGKK